MEGIPRHVIYDSVGDSEANSNQARPKGLHAAYKLSSFSKKNANDTVQNELRVTHDSSGVSKENLVDHDSEDLQYPRGIKLYLTTVALCLSIFCVALDNTIIATAIPRITDTFSSINDIGWYGSSYLLTTCAFQLLYGKLYTIFSLKWTFLLALGLFEVGSAICGAAPSSAVLIIGRAISGLGCAGLFSGALLIIADTVPVRTRPTYTGLLGSMYGIASVAGPLLGGVFTDQLSWRWCFWINLPVGGATALFILACYKPAGNVGVKGYNGNGLKKTFWQLDPVGTILFLAMVICLLLALQFGGAKYPWSEGRVIALLVISGACLFGFAFSQVKGGANSTIPTKVASQRTVMASSWFSFCLGGSFFTMVFFVPIWFQATKGVDATSSAIRTIPLLLSLIVMCIISGALTTVFGYYTPFIWTSAILASIGAGLMTTWSVESHSAMWIGYQVVFGLGAGAGLQQPLMAVQNVLPDDLIPIGTALVMFSQTFGGSVFVSAAQNVFANRLLSNMQSIVPGIDRSAILLSGATSFQDVVPPELLDAVRAACSNAITRTFMLSVVMAALSALGAILIENKRMKGRMF